MPTRLTTIAVASAAGLAALGVTLVGIPALADAATNGTSPGDAVGKRVSAIRSSLQGLVDDKTLTDAQADKVAETLGEKGPPLGGPGDGFGPLGRGFALFGGLDEAAKVLGMSTDDVRTALRDGTTLADLAKQKGKDVADVEAALTKSANARIDEAVENGRLTKARGDEAKQRVAEGVKTFVEKGFPGKGFGKFGGPGFPRGGPWKDGGPHGGPWKDGGPRDEQPAPGPSASTSAFNA